MSQRGWEKAAMDILDVMDMNSDCFILSLLLSSEGPRGSKMIVLRMAIYFMRTPQCGPRGSLSL